MRASFLREYFGKEFFGKLLGITLGTAAVGGIIGPTVAGWVFDVFGSYHFVWLMFCGFICVAIVLALKIEPKTPKSTV